MTKLIVCTAGFALVAMVAPAADSERMDVTGVRPALHVGAGTPIRLRLEKTLSSADARVNDPVPFAVREPVDIAGTVVIPKGSSAWGTITAAAPRGRMARSGKLTVNINAVCLADGQSAPLRAIQRTEEAVLHKTRAETSVGDSLFAFPAWPVLLFMYGKETTIPAGTELTVYVDRNLTIDPANVNSAQPAPQCNSAVAAAEEAPKTASVANIRSNPDGAEISVDGRYAGNTPSRLHLTPGEHRIAISLPGRQVWERSIVVNQGSEISVAATLPETRPTVGSRIEPAGAVLSKLD